jgi:hypothetical protein
MSNYNKFLINLEKFKKYELEAARRIKIKFNVEIIKFNDNNEYDFLTNDNLKYEVKC